MDTLYITTLKQCNAMLDGLHLPLVEVQHLTVLVGRDRGSAAVQPSAENDVAALGAVGG